MSENRFPLIPTAVYGVTLLAAAIACYLLQTILLRVDGEQSLLRTAIGTDLKGKVSPLLCPRRVHRRRGLGHCDLLGRSQPGDITEADRDLRGGVPGLSVACPLHDCDHRAQHGPARVGGVGAAPIPGRFVLRSSPVLHATGVAVRVWASTAPPAPRGVSRATVTR
jgi:hypothetical protein